MVIRGQKNVADLTIRDSDLSKSGGNPQWLTKSEAAAYLNCSERFVERLITERRVDFHKFGKFVRLSPQDLDAFAAAGRIEKLIEERPHRSRRSAKQDP